MTPPPEALRGVVRIAAGAYHSMAVREDGRLVVWGDAASGVTDVPDLARPGGVVEAAGGWGVAVAVRDPAAGDPTGGDPGQANVRLVTHHPSHCTFTAALWGCRLARGGG